MTEYFPLNFILIGDANVGKSNLLQRLTKRTFQENHHPTVGIEFGTIKVNHKDQLYKITIWDTAGQERYHSLVRTYYKNALGVLLVYDISQRDSFKNLGKWIEDIKRYSNQEVSIMLVGNKADLEHTKRQVSTEEGQEFAIENQLEGFVETSASDGNNVETAFFDTLKIIHSKVENGLVMLNSKTDLKTSKNIEIRGQKMIKEYSTCFC